jgi:hypothetical protein
MIVGAWNYIRLRGGISNYSGRVEVKIAGAWGQICGRYWSRNDAIVACPLYNDKVLTYNDKVLSYNDKVSSYNEGTGEAQ